MGIVAVLVAAVATAAATSGTAPQLVRVAIVADGPGGTLEPVIREEMAALLSGDFDVRYPDDLRFDGPRDPDRIRADAERAMRDPRADIVLATGPIGSHVAARRRPARPTIAAAVFDPEAQGLPRTEDASGVRNLAYVVLPIRIRDDLTRFIELHSFTRIVVLVDRTLDRAIPSLRETVIREARAVGVESDIVAVDDRAVAALDRLPPDTAAVYVTPLISMPPSETPVLAAGLIERGVPSFVMFGHEAVEAGFFATRSPEGIRQRLGRRVALDVQRILLGEDAGTLPVTLTERSRMTINMKTARALGVWPSWALMTEATLIDAGAVEEGGALTLERAVRQALTANRDLDASERRLQAGEKRVDRARGPLLPQVGLSSRGTWIDSDRAAVSFGLVPERTWSAAAAASQVLYDDALWAAWSIEGHEQERRISEHEETRLDVAGEMAVAYLDLLRAQTIERIQRENLEVTRKNLEIAHNRERVGEAGRAEVLRWESEVARSRRRSIDAIFRRRQTRVAVNRLRHRPLAEPVRTAESQRGDQHLLANLNALLAYIDNPARFERFSNFMVEEGRTASPELRQLDAAISGRRRELTATRRSFWVPRVSLQAEVSERLASSGSGESGIDLSALAGRLDLPAAPDDRDWIVGVVATLPLFQGGARWADLGRLRYELERLQSQRESVAEMIEERIRSSLYRAAASHAGIELSRHAADAARENLRLVTDAYAKGAVSITELLDAQEARLDADQAAANAVYDFLIDWMRVERSIGRFQFFMPREARDAWLERMSEAMQEPAPEESP